jgi:anaerobic magnesium-protoporphyrin IX monomethyl ester cyclase
MRIALINSASQFLVDPMVFSPLGLWYVGAVVAKNPENEVDYFDLNVDELPGGYDAYLVTGTTPQVRSMMAVAKRLGTGHKLIAGGPHASIAPQELLKAGYHWVVRGEGEPVINDILAGKIPQGIITVPRITDMKTIPHPIRKWAVRYHYKMDKRTASHAMVSRGCPWSCHFCCHALWGQKTTYMPMDWVYEELMTIANQGYRAVMFYDDTFTVEQDRAISIGEMLHKRKLAWRCFIRADTIDADLAKEMARLGCVEVGLGVESGSDRILMNVGKRTTSAQNTKAVEICQEAGIRVKAFLIVGLPGETEQSFQETKDWVEKAQPYDFDATLFVPYPGTPIMMNKEDYDVNWDGMESSQLWYKGIPGHYSSHVWTKGVSRERLGAMREELESLKRVPIGG